MLVAAAVCPCPPLLVPEVAAGAAPELDAARAACTDALGVLAAARPDRLVVVGPAERERPRPAPAGHAAARSAASAWTSTYAWGASWATAGGQPPERGPARASPRRSAAWLLERAGWADAPVEGLGVGGASRRRAVRRRSEGTSPPAPSGWRCW